MEKIIHDLDLGSITLRYSPRATRYSLKLAKGSIQAIMPLQGDEQVLLRFIRENKEKIQKKLQQMPTPLWLDDQCTLRTATFQVHIFRSKGDDFNMWLSNETLHLATPAQTRFERAEVQEQLKKMLEAALRHEAKRCLPARLRSLAQSHGFTYNRIKINNSRTHWGSCTQQKNINLSLSLMLLPWHLIDYVLLHELCHTLEMNHSERFWQLMDQVTNYQAKALRSALRKHTIL